MLSIVIAFDSNVISRSLRTPDKTFSTLKRGDRAESLSFVA